MSGIKLTYFNLKGRAELARLILAQAEVEYEDCRIEKEDWPELKKSEIESTQAGVMLFFYRSSSRTAAGGGGGGDDYRAVHDYCKILG